MMNAKSVALFTAACLAASAPASADTFTVLTLGDGPIAACVPTGPTTNDCTTVRDAIAAANTSANPDTVFLAPGRHVLTFAGYDDANAFGDLDITPSGVLTLMGAGGGASVIDAGGLGAPDRVLHVQPGASVEVIDVGITGGWIDSSLYVPTQGGGILNEGTALVLHSDVSGNFVNGVFKRDGGGGIANTGLLDVIDSVVHNNVVDEGSGGGLLTTAAGTAQVFDSRLELNTVTNGWGGGLSSRGATSVSNTQIDSNSAWWGGGGVFVDNDGAGNLAIDHSSITRNTVTKAVTTQGGGGLLADRGATAVALSNATIGLNNAPASYGGGLRTINGANVTLDHVTHHQNADTYGLGVDCTGGFCNVGESIIGDPCWAPVFPYGTNLQAAPGCGLSITAPVMLGGLGGGPTLAFPPLPGSPALGASTVCPVDDQWFLPRGTVACTLGAIE